MSDRTAPRWVITRSAWIERWRFGIKLRVFHGFGLAKFEFEFRLGFPKKVEQPEWITYEEPLNIEDGFGI